MVNVLYVYEKGGKGEIDPSNMLGDEEEDRDLKEALMKKGKITVRRWSKFNLTCSKIVNLLIVTRGKKNHYICIKNVSRLLSRENHIKRNEHYVNCKDHDAVKVEMPSEKNKWLQYHYGQNQFKIPFMMYADFESILKPMDERYKDKMKQNE